MNLLDLFLRRGYKGLTQIVPVRRSPPPKARAVAHPISLFLSAATIRNSKDRLVPLVVNQVWNEVCAMARVTGKSPHAARHAMGRHIIDKTGNIAAVQRQLGHRNVAYSVQYARV